MKFQLLFLIVFTANLANAITINYGDAQVIIPKTIEKIDQSGFGLELARIRFEPCKNIYKNITTSRDSHANVSFLCLDECLCGADRPLLIDEQGISVRTAADVNAGVCGNSRKGEKNYLVVLGGKGDRRAQVCENFLKGNGISFETNGTCELPPTPAQTCWEYDAQKMILTTVGSFAAGLMLIAYGAGVGVPFYAAFLAIFFAVNFFKTRNAQEAWAKTRENKKILLILGIASTILGVAILWLLIGLLG